MTGCSPQNAWLAAEGRGTKHTAGARREVQVPLVVAARAELGVPRVALQAARDGLPAQRCCLGHHLRESCSGCSAATAWLTKLRVQKQQQPQTCLLARRRVSAYSACLIYLNNYVVICFCVSCHAERIYQDLIADVVLLVVIATGTPTCGAADQDQCKDA